MNYLSSCLKRFVNLIEIRHRLSKDYTFINYLLTYESIFALRYTIMHKYNAYGDNVEFNDHRKLAVKNAIWCREHV